jgi:hypothetical protein
MDKQRRRMAGAVAATATVAILVGACSSSGGTPADSSTSAGASTKSSAHGSSSDAPSSSSAPSTSTAAVKANIDAPCTVLTKGDAEQIIGELGETNTGPGGCHYDGADVSKHLGIGINSGSDYPGGWSAEVQARRSDIKAMAARLAWSQSRATGRSSGA